MRVTKEDVKKAKQVNLIAFLSCCYPEAIVYVPRQHSYRHPTYDSLVIGKNLWHRFSTGEGGDQIQYLINFCDKSFQAAVAELCGFFDAPSSATAKVSTSDTELWQESFESEYKPPKRLKKCDTITRYLHGRGIPSDTIKMLIDDGLLYEDRKHNCVFQRANPGICILRGTSEEKWSKIIREEPNNFWFFKVGNNPENIYICEAPLDAISLYECNKRRPGYYCAMAGLKPNTYLKILDELAFDEAGLLCKNIKIAVDWDERGEFFLKNKVDSAFPFVAIRPTPKERLITKDWNDVLLLRNSNPQES